MSERYWKFLAQGGVAPISGVPWPRPAPGGTDWLGGDGPVVLCRTGVHVCRSGDLAYWLHDELWEVEIGGDVVEGFDCVVAPRGRLLREVDAWRGELGARFARAATEHALAAVGMAGSAEQARVANYVAAAQHLAGAGLAVGAGYVAAVAVARMHDRSADIEAAFRGERAFQSSWLAAAIDGV